MSDTRAEIQTPIDAMMADIESQRQQAVGSDICKHCDVPVMEWAGRLIHASGYWGTRPGSRTCTSAVADVHEGSWTDDLFAKREALRGKVATRKRI